MKIILQLVKKLVTEEFIVYQPMGTIVNYPWRLSNFEKPLPEYLSSFNLLYFRPAMAIRFFCENAWRSR